MSTITLPKPVRWDLPDGLKAVSQARRLAGDWLAAWAPDATDSADNLQLAVSELVTNAFEHGEPPVTLAISASRRDADVTVTTVVHDGGAKAPRVVDADPLEESHRGMFLVGAVTDKWGIRDAVGGKDVWFEITVPASAIVAAEPSAPSLSERIFAALTHQVPGPRVSRQHDAHWNGPGQQIPYSPASHAEVLLDIEFADILHSADRGDRL